MSYDLLVCEGVRPADPDEAEEAAVAVLDLLDEGDQTPPSPTIEAYVARLTAAYPDLGDDDDDTSPWADGPLIGNAFGPHIYFAMTYSGAQRARDFCASTAHDLGLLVFDPQEERYLAPEDIGAKDRRLLRLAWWSFIVPMLAMYAFRVSTERRPGLREAGQPRSRSLRRAIVLSGIGMLWNVAVVFTLAVLFPDLGTPQAGG